MNRRDPICPVRRLGRPQSVSHARRNGHYTDRLERGRRLGRVLVSRFRPRLRKSQIVGLIIHDDHICRVTARNLLVPPVQRSDAWPGPAGQLIDQNRGQSFGATAVGVLQDTPKEFCCRRVRRGTSVFWARHKIHWEGRGRQERDDISVGLDARKCHGTWGAARSRRRQTRHQVDLGVPFGLGQTLRRRPVHMSQLVVRKFHNQDLHCSHMIVVSDAVVLVPLEVTGLLQRRADLESRCRQRAVRAGDASGRNTSHAPHGVDRGPVVADIRTEAVGLFLSII